MSKLSKQALEKLKEQRDKLNARIQQKEARLKSSERKIDARKKILIGSYFLDNAIKENKLDEIKLVMDKYLKRNSDRALFDLELLPES
ncbi:MAG TPA: mobilization protein [Candidatus Babeliales bacterium]|nr:mobilization protein [Candidatus Babeliales bacterium]